MCELRPDCRHPTDKGGEINSDNSICQFPNGGFVLLTRVCEGQHATILQLPAAQRMAEGERENKPLSSAGPRGE